MSLRWSYWVLLFTVVLGVNQGSVLADNLILNGGFESTTGEGINEWMICQGTNVVDLIEKDADNVHEGDVAAHLKFNDAADATASKVALQIKTRKKLENVVPGTEYKLAFYAKASEDKQPLVATYYTNANKKPHFYKKKPFSLSTTWAPYEFLLKIPDETEWDNRELYIKFEIGKGEAFIDDVVLAPSNETNPEDSKTPEPKSDNKSKAGAGGDSQHRHASASGATPVQEVSPKEFGDTGKVAGIDAAKRTLLVILEGFKEKIPYSMRTDTTVTLDGKPAKLDDLKEKMSVFIVPDADPLYAVSIKAKSH